MASADDMWSDDESPEVDPSTPLEPIPDDHCLAGITDYAEAGPFTFMQPASGFGAQPVLDGLWPQVYARIRSPVFMFSGWITDGLVPEPWVALAYLALSPDVEAYYWAKLSTHIPVPNLAERQVSIAWFRWKLLGDRDACEYFHRIPTEDGTWQVRAEKKRRALFLVGSAG